MSVTDEERQPTIVREAVLWYDEQLHADVPLWRFTRGSDVAYLARERLPGKMPVRAGGERPFTLGKAVVYSLPLVTSQGPIHIRPAHRGPSQDSWMVPTSTEPWFDDEDTEWEEYGYGA